MNAKGYIVNLKPVNVRVRVLLDLALLVSFTVGLERG